MTAKSLLVLTLSILQSCIAFSQNDNSATGSPDSIVREMLDIISAGPGEQRDTAAFRNLFLPSAKFMVNTHSPEKPFQEVSLDQFVKLLRGTQYEKGFEERELSRKVDEFNGIAQVFQVYEAHGPDGYHERGINSFQLIQFEGRWWITSCLWTGESEDNPVPNFD